MSAGPEVNLPRVEEVVRQPVRPREPALERRKRNLQEIKHVLVDLLVSGFVGWRRSEGRGRRRGGNP